jgi:predicted DNA-binding WGR domain protein
VVDFKIKFFGHAHDPNENSDKIWGWVDIEGKLYNFWGRRGTLETPKRVSFKRNPNTWEGNHDLRRLTEKKKNPGGDKIPYQEITLTRQGDVYEDIDGVYPGFSAHFRKQLMFARLGDNVKGEGSNDR